MQLITKLAAAGVAAVGIVAGGVALSPAHADSMHSRVVDVQLTNRLDSGEDGNNWANDNMRRQIKLTESTPGTYVVTVRDIGSFTTIVDQKTPGNDDGPAVFSSPVTGVINGGFTATVQAAANFATFDSSALVGPIDGGEVGTAAMVDLLFSDNGHMSEISAWSWSYRYKGQVWLNAESGNSGNISA